MIHVIKIDDNNIITQAKRLKEGYVLEPNEYEISMNDVANPLDSYDPSTGIITPAGEQTEFYQISVGAFKRRFTFDERKNLRKSIRAAIKKSDNGNASNEEEALLDFDDMLNSAGYVDLNDPELPNGLGLLSLLGIIESFRVSELMVPGTAAEERN